MDLKDQLRAALTTANGLYAKSMRTEDEERQLAETLQRANSLKAQIEQGDQLKALNDSAAQLAPDPVQQRFADIEATLQRFQAEPALKNSGHITMDGANADKNIHNFADFFMAVRRNDVVRIKSHYKTAMAEDTGGYGGYLVPTEFAGMINKIAAEDSVVRSHGAKVIPMKGREYKVPALNQFTAPSAGATQYYGGVVGTWVDEAGTLTETEPTFEMVSLIPHKLAGYSLASNELREDDPASLEALLIDLFGGAKAWYEDYAFLRGNGVGQPLGVLNAPALIGLNRTGSGNDFDFADIGLLERRLMASSMKKAIWVCHPLIRSSIYALANTSTVSSYLGVLTQGPTPMLMGREIVYSEKMVTAGSAGDVLLADFSQYLIGDKGEMTVAFSEHYRFVNDQAAWRFTHRVDGQPWMRLPITLTDASTTVGPFVAFNN